MRWDPGRGELVHVAPRHPPCGDPAKHDTGEQDGIPEIRMVRKSKRLRWPGLPARQASATAIHEPLTNRTLTGGRP